MNTCVVFIQHILSDKHHLFKMHIHEAYHLRMIIQSTHYNITGKSDSSYAEKKRISWNIFVYFFTTNGLLHHAHLGIYIPVISIIRIININLHSKQLAKLNFNL